MQKESEIVKENLGKRRTADHKLHNAPLCRRFLSKGNLHVAADDITPVSVQTKKTASMVDGCREIHLKKPDLLSSLLSAQMQGEST